MNKISPWTLLQPRKDVCQQCAVDHPPDLPHDQQSLHYQYWFFSQHNRWPTWADAMAHCDEDMKVVWIEELAKHGIEIQEVAASEQT